jgi:hypothetical protein
LEKLTDVLESFFQFVKLVAGESPTMANIYTGLVVIIALAVVYNSARISLFERARELASVRVLGFTGGEVLRILLLELALLTLVAQPPGWGLGYGLAWTLKEKMSADVMRSRLIVEHSTYALATAVVLIAAVRSASRSSGSASRSTSSIHRKYGLALGTITGSLSTSLSGAPTMRSPFRSAPCSGRAAIGPSSWCRTAVRALHRSRSGTATAGLPNLSPVWRQGSGGAPSERPRERGNEGWRREG